MWKNARNSDWGPNQNIYGYRNDIKQPDKQKSTKRLKTCVLSEWPFTFLTNYYRINYLKISVQLTINNKNDFSKRCMFKFNFRDLKRLFMTFMSLIKLSLLRMSSTAGDETSSGRNPENGGRRDFGRRGRRQPGFQYTVSMDQGHLAQNCSFIHSVSHYLSLTSPL